MKPCANNKKSIALLALDELDGEPARELQSHLKVCEGCRNYHAEISSVTGKLAAPEADTDIRTSVAFHQRVVNALRTGGQARTEGPLAQLRLIFVNWRPAWAVAGALAALVAVLAITMPARRDPAPVPGPVTANALPAPDLSVDLPPTIGNYERVANRSLDKLDELLTLQGNRNLPPAPVYTASSLARANLSD